MPAAKTFSVMVLRKAGYGCNSTKLQPYHHAASGPDSLSSGAIAIGGRTSGVSFCDRCGELMLQPRRNGAPQPAEIELDQDPVIQ